MFNMNLTASNRLLAALVAAALLALPACGFRGPLYLPGEAPPGTETPAQATEDEKDEADQEDGEGNDGEEGNGDPSAPASP